MNNELKFGNKEKLTLYKQLKKLNDTQFKVFYGAFVHYLMNCNCFISKQNLFNLYCELNQLCHEFDESCPAQYDDHELMKSFFLAHPYYYMEKLPIVLLARLFAEYVDDHINILSGIAKTAFEADIYATYSYANKALGLNEQIDTLTEQVIKHMEDFS